MSQEQLPLVDQRQFHRVGFEITAAIVLSSGEVLTAEVENLSFEGMFLRGCSDIPAGTELTAQLSLRHTGGDITYPDLDHLIESGAEGITLFGRVVRSTPEGSGVEFTETDYDSFSHLKNLIKYNLGDEFESEFARFVAKKTERSDINNPG